MTQNIFYNPVSHSLARASRSHLREIRICFGIRENKFEVFHNLCKERIFLHILFTTISFTREHLQNAKENPLGFRNFIERNISSSASPSFDSPILHRARIKHHMTHSNHQCKNVISWYSIFMHGIPSIYVLTLSYYWDNERWALLTMMMCNLINGGVVKRESQPFSILLSALSGGPGSV